MTSCLLTVPDGHTHATNSPAKAAVSSDRPQLYRAKQRPDGERSAELQRLDCRELHRLVDLWLCRALGMHFVGTDGDRRPPLYKWHSATEYTLLKPEQDTASLCGLSMRETCLSCGGATPANDTVRLGTMPCVAHTADRVQPHELRCLQFLTIPHACLFIRTQSDAPVVACDIASSETRMFRLSYTTHKDTVRTAQ